MTKNRKIARVLYTLLTNSIGGKQPVLLLLNTPGWSD